MFIKLTGLAALAGFALSLGTTAAVAQKAVEGSETKLECAANEITRSGRPWRSKFLAKRAARNAWRQKVVNRNNLGKDYSGWYNAKKSDDPYNCRRKKSKGKKRWVCKATATPCKALVLLHIPGRICSPYQYNGTGKAHKFEFLAKNNARKVWKARVKDIVGSKFDTWTFSHSKEITCKESGGKTTCTAMAKPCRVSLNPYKDKKGKLAK